MTSAPQNKKGRQEAGGPSRDGYLALGSAGADIETQVIVIEGLTNADLRIEWRRLFRATPTTRLSRDLLIRGSPTGFRNMLMAA
jgi:hypothetical protein